VRTPVEQRGFELLDEKSLAATFASGRSRVWSPRVVMPSQIDRRPGMELKQPFAHVFGLPNASGLSRVAMTSFIANGASRSMQTRDTKAANARTLAALCYLARRRGIPMVQAKARARDAETRLREDIRLLGRLLGDV